MTSRIVTGSANTDNSGGITQADIFDFQRLYGSSIYIDENNSRIGIFDATPSYTLDINGTLRSTGDAFFNDDVTINQTLTLNGTKMGTRLSSSVSAGWRRVAYLNNRSQVNFRVFATVSGRHCMMEFQAGYSYYHSNGGAYLKMLNSPYGTSVKHVRMLRKSTYDTVYVEVYCDASMTIEVTDLGSKGDAAVQNTGGSVPSGYTSHQLTDAHTYIEATCNAAYGWIGAHSRNDRVQLIGNMYSGNDLSVDDITADDISSDTLTASGQVRGNTLRSDDHTYVYGRLRVGDKSVHSNHWKFSRSFFEDYIYSASGAYFGYDYAASSDSGYSFIGYDASIGGDLTVGDDITVNDRIYLKGQRMYGGSTSDTYISLEDDDARIRFGLYNTYNFAWQNDRNVVLYTGSTPIWSTGTSTSDIRLKDNIEKVNGLSALESMSKVDAIWFDWKDKKEMGDQREIGFSAQDIEKIYPTAVKAFTPKLEPEDDPNSIPSEPYKILYKEALIPVVWEAVKELKNQLDKAHAKIAELESKMES